VLYDVAISTRMRPMLLSECSWENVEVKLANL
jgi:hypothetical protein